MLCDFGRSSGETSPMLFLVWANSIGLGRAQDPRSNPDPPHIDLKADPVKVGRVPPNLRSVSSQADSSLGMEVPPEALPHRGGARHRAAVLGRMLKRSTASMTRRRSMVQAGAMRQLSGARAPASLGASSCPRSPRDGSPPRPRKLYPAPAAAGATPHGEGTVVARPGASAAAGVISSVSATEPAGGFRHSPACETYHSASCRGRRCRIAGVARPRAMSEMVSERMSA